MEDHPQMEDRPHSGIPSLDPAPAPSPIAEATAPERERFPWPPARGEPALQALAETWRRSMFEPSRFYRALAPDAPLGAALLYYVVTGVLGAGVSLFWDTVFALAGVTEGPLAILAGSGGDWTWSVVGFLLSPLWLVASLYVATAIYHVALVILGAARKGFGGSLRVFAYAGAPQLLLVVPVLGRLLVVIGGVVLIVVGIREVHGTSTGRAVAAVLLPIPALMALGFVFAIFFALATLAA